MISRDPRAALATVLAEGFLGRLTFGMVSFAFPLYALSLGLSLAEIGLLISLRTVLALLLKPVAGWLADRIGVRTVYLAGAFARVLAALGLLVAGGIVGLAVTRLLQGASAAGRDVASLSVIARDARERVGSVYSWYATAKHVGSVGGAALAGLIIGLSGGDYGALFLLIAGLSVLPLAAAWIGLREVADPVPAEGLAPATAVDHPPEVDHPPAAGSRPTVAGLIRELAGPATVGTLVATAAYMVHGIFPVLAVEYAGLSAAQAGIVYSLSAGVFLVAGPVFGWVVDRRGPTVGLAWRSIANVGSSLIYLLSPTFVGLAVARSIDDSGKAAFRPAWASKVAEVAAVDPSRRGQRLGLLDTSEDVGEAIGPALAGVLWQSGGIGALFAVRIVIALVAELAVLKVFGQHGQAPRSTTAAAKGA